MNIHDWAKRHNIPYGALTELFTEVGALPDAMSDLSEGAIQTNIRIEASRVGIRLWRNNVGAGTIISDKGDESFVRWGLANESKQMNEVIKSGDLIGIRPITVTQEHVGRVIGQFVSREVKHGKWRYTGTPREVAQMNWINIINVMGGDAQFAIGEGTL